MSRLLARRGWRRVATRGGDRGLTRAPMGGGGGVGLSGGMRAGGVFGEALETLAKGLEPVVGWRVDDSEFQLTVPAKRDARANDFGGVFDAGVLEVVAGAGG